ncbi:glycoside hydrolase family 3 N-terminal domain-containing protein [Streptomyces sp. NPDC102360]|uniref:glycoside hydrolase family 3 protein n=1 Tax=Streptomyces sp. NPDC102360 TaxID=3366160 RepID=UPI0037F59A8A
MARPDVGLPYQDPTLPVEQRVDDLVSRLSPQDKAGQMFHPMGTLQDVDTPNIEFGLPALRPTIEDQRITHFGLLGTKQTPREFAAWHNEVQRIALDRPLGIPVTFSTDTRHALSADPRNALTGDPESESPAGFFSQWPETLGLAAIGSDKVTEHFADIVRQEYRSVGLHVALHPQADLATEPRWARIFTTFGEDVDLVSRMAAAYVRGLDGAHPGGEAVAAMVKHFPGGGPQKDGEDPHFPYGREQVYPGGQFELHLKPFIAALEAGATQMMPYYGMPVGTEHEEVGFGFNRSVITGLLRERLGFDGIVCTDWSLISDGTALGDDIAARAWGVEQLTPEQRLLKALDAGVDQFGGEYRTDLVLELLRKGAVSQERIDRSVRRILTEKFRLGLFDGPFVDPERAEQVAGCAAFKRAGLDAQRRSLTLLTNRASGDASRLPLRDGLRVYAEGIAPAALEEYAEAAASPSEADVAVLRVRAPFEARDGLAAGFHAGSLEFDEAERDRILSLAKQVPTALVIFLDRPAVLGELADAAAAILADFGSGDEALLQVLFGRAAPRGRLPFDLPSSMRAVLESRSDVPFDTVEPQFHHGHGLAYEPGPLA